jgi:hypothetical protein
MPQEPFKNTATGHYSTAKVQTLYYKNITERATKFMSNLVLIKYIFLQAH